MKKIYFIILILSFSSDLLPQLKLSYNSKDVIGENRITGYAFDTDSVKVVSQKSPALACVLSLLVPGLGQVYNGEIIKGLLFATGVVAGTYLLVFSGGDFEHESSTSEPLFYTGMIVAGVSYLWSIIDAPVSASRINEERRLNLLGGEIELQTCFSNKDVRFFTRIYFN